MSKRRLLPPPAPPAAVLLRSLEPVIAWIVQTGDPLRRSSQSAQARALGAEHAEPSRPNWRWHGMHGMPPDLQECEVSTVRGRERSARTMGASVQEKHHPHRLAVSGLLPLWPATVPAWMPPACRGRASSTSSWSRGTCLPRGRRPRGRPRQRGRARSRGRRPGVKASNRSRAILRHPGEPVGGQIPVMARPREDPPYLAMYALSARSQPGGEICFAGRSRPKIK